MHYADPILKSATDKDYRGGGLFLNLIQRGTLQPAVSSLNTEGYQVFAVDGHCYVDRKFDRFYHRAVILMNTTTPKPESDIRLFLVEGFGSRKEPRYIEVLPEPDTIYSFYENQWVHDLKWFLSGKAFSIGFYKTMVNYKNVIPMKRGYDIFGNKIINVGDILRFVDQVSELLEWVTQTAKKHSTVFGYQQRNEQYYPALRSTLGLWKHHYKGPSYMWGIFDSEQRYFIEDEKMSLHAYLFNALTHYILHSTDTEVHAIKSPLIYLVVQAIHERLDDETCKKLAPFYPKQPWTLNKIRVYRKKLIDTGAVGGAALWAMLPDLNTGSQNVKN